MMDEVVTLNHLHGKIKDYIMMIGIIGAGYSGVALAFNIHREAQEPAHVLLFERRRQH